MNKAHLARESYGDTIFLFPNRSLCSYLKVIRVTGYMAAKRRRSKSIILVFIFPVLDHFVIVIPIVVVFLS